MFNAVILHNFKVAQENFQEMICQNDLMRCSNGDIIISLLLFKIFHEKNWYSLILTQKFHLINRFRWFFFKVFRFELKAPKICWFIGWNFSSRIAQFGADNIEALRNECNAMAFFSLMSRQAYTIGNMGCVCMASIALES